MVSVSLFSGMMDARSSTTILVEFRLLPGEVGFTLKIAILEGITGFAQAINSCGWFIDGLLSRQRSVLREDESTKFLGLLRTRSFWHI